MELLDVVDENNSLTGKIEDREIIHATGLWHREVAVVILNENNEILVEKRSANKKQAPNKWALCAGHIEAGDIPEKAIIREIYEEVGIELNIEDLEFLTILKRNIKFSDSQYNRSFSYIYLLKTDKKIEDYKIQLEELSQVKYFSIDYLENEINKQNDKEDDDFTFLRKKYMKEVIKILKNEI